MRKIQDFLFAIPWSGYAPLVLFVFLIALLLRYHSVSLPVQGYKVGDIAREDVYAPTDLNVIDEESTSKRRKESADAVKAVYDYNIDETQKTLERISDAFGLVRQTLSEKQNDSGLQNVVRRKFEDALGVQVSQEEFRSLWTNRFSRLHETAIRNLVLATTKNLNIVSSKELIEPDLAKGVVRRTLQGSEVQKEESFEKISEIYDLNDIRSLMREQLQDVLGNSLQLSRKQTLGVAQKIIRPTLTYNQAETEHRRKLAFESDHNSVPILVRKGAIIVRAGNVIEPRHLTIFRGFASSKNHTSDWLVILGVFLLCLLLVDVVRQYSKNFYRLKLTMRDYYLIASAVLFVILISKFFIFIGSGISKSGYRIPNEAFNYLLPLCTAPMLVRIVVGSEAALLVSILTAFFGGLLLDNSIYLGIYFFIGSIFGANEVTVVRKRVDLLRAGVMTGGVSALAVAFSSAISVFSDHINASSFLDVSWNMGMAFCSGLLAAFLLTVMLTLAEMVFNYTSDFKLLELASQNSPLLRELMVQAPGTYHHSIIIGSLSEAAANSIGENGLLARVACLYHDIGKTKKPLYFVENQTQGENRHDKLTPRMSARVIQAHVKDGIEMAKEEKLPPEIIDIIPQHHGTRLVSFFYKKAKAQADPQMETIDEKDFRYEGPKPQTRVAGIVLLADGLEAITRTLDDPTPARIKGVVRDHINKIFSEGELDETELTLRDLSAIANSFIRVLTSIFHHRIDYPTTSVDYPSSGIGEGSIRLRKIHDHQDSKQTKQDSTRSSQDEGDTEGDSPRLKIT